MQIGGETEVILQITPDEGFMNKAHFRQGSKVQGPMNSRNLIGQKLYIVAKAFKMRVQDQKVAN